MVEQPEWSWSAAADVRINNEELSRWHISFIYRIHRDEEVEKIHGSDDAWRDSFLHWIGCALRQRCESWSLFVDRKKGGLSDYRYTPTVSDVQRNKDRKTCCKYTHFQCFQFVFFLFFGLVLPLARRICVMISLWRHKLNEVSFSTPASKVCDYICTHQLTRHLLLMLLVRWNQNFGRHN